ncbi:5'-3'_deoxyribonucleotidase [Hexamita inflata]|uniref:Putative n=1 Tax=Hexamita inflata TaxID=28002 RepID=A0AA86V1S1_9EUKA|nr:5'-3' deoxyribonucleotidase [Hexamita inflata]
MQPTNSSILVDMDGTLFNFVDVYKKRLSPHKIGDVTEYDVLETQLKESILKAQLSMNAMLSASFFADENPYDQMVSFVQKLINQYDVWFVTAPIGYYHLKSGINEKRAQIQRLYGQNAAQKMIFTAEKHKVPGQFLIDDHPKIVKMKAEWKPVMVNQAWNTHIPCEIRLDLSNPQIEGL